MKFDASILYTVVVCGSVLHKISIPGMKQSVSHLVGDVDGGPCLEEYPHHTGVAFVGCYCQRSASTLWGDVERVNNMMQGKALWMS